MWGLSGCSFLLSSHHAVFYCFVFYVINMKENKFIKLLFSQNKPFSQNIFTADSYSPFFSVTKTISQLLLSSHLCKLSSISETTKDDGFLVVLSKQQLCFHSVKKYYRNYDQLEVKVKIFIDF